MLPALRGERPTPPTALYWEFYERGSAQAVRFGRWKAIREPMFDGPIRLYDLFNDLGEERDRPRSPWSTENGLTHQIQQRK